MFKSPDRKKRWRIGKISAVPQSTVSRFQVCMLNLDAVYIHPTTIWLCNHICHRGFLCPEPMITQLTYYIQSDWMEIVCVVNGKCKSHFWQSTSLIILALLTVVAKWQFLILISICQERQTEDVYMSVTWVQGLTKYSAREINNTETVSRQCQGSNMAAQFPACWNKSLKSSKYWLCFTSVYLWGFLEKGNSFFIWSDFTVF